MNCYMTARYFSAIALTGTLDYSTDFQTKIVRNLQNYLKATKTTQYVIILTS